MRILTKIKIAWLNRKLARLYRQYHRSFEKRMYDADVMGSLPIETIRYRDRFNATLTRLAELDPDTNWMHLS